MIIYWQIGRNCNLGCKYCNIMEVKKFQNKKDTEYKDINSLIKFVKTIINNNGQDPIDLVFYGGEPLLYQDSIMEFIEKSRGLKIRHSLHTNGILLDKINPEILPNIETIILSIDGSERINDQNRGSNVYSKIRRNIEKIRRNYEGEIIARTTLTLDASIKDVVLDLITWLDGIYWQIENLPTFDPITTHKFLERYTNDIRGLVDFWVKEAQAGRMINILPFQAIATTILLKRQEETLRCGCGSRLIITDGIKCFACDELAEYADEVYLGTIYEKIDVRSSILSQKVYETCGDCQIHYICGGRCYASLAYFPRDKFEFYCKATHILVESIREAAPNIESLIRNKVMNIAQISHPALRLVDQIP
jgi:radical SAM protein with 4Fe4S-binding SPASM domain